MKRGKRGRAVEYSTLYAKDYATVSTVYKRQENDVLHCGFMSNDRHCRFVRSRSFMITLISCYHVISD